MNKQPILFSVMVALGVCGLPFLSCGQTIYHFSNLSPGRLDAPVFEAGGTRLAGTNYGALLYAGPTAGALSIALDYETRLPMTPTPFTLLVPYLAGYFDGGIVEVDSVGCGGTAWLQVRAWDLRLGATYEQVEALGLGGYGASSLFEKQGGNACGLPSPAEPLIGLESFSLVPEPHPFILLLLALPWVFVRRWAKMLAHERQPGERSVATGARGQTGRNAVVHRIV